MELNYFIVPVLYIIHYYNNIQCTYNYIIKLCVVPAFGIVCDIKMGTKMAA